MQLQKLNRLSGIALLSTAVFAVSFQTAIAQVAPGDLSKLSARPARDWVRDGVIYEIYPRDFSAAGNFKGVTAQLDRLKDLGVSILWLK